MQSEVASCVLLGSSQPQADAPPTNALSHAHATRWGASLPATETTLVASTRTSASARPQGRARIFGILGANSAAHLCGSGHETRRGSCRGPGGMSMPGRQALRLLVSMMLCTGGTQQLWTEGGGLQAGAAAGRMIWMMQGKYEMDLAFLRSEHSDAIQVRRRSMASRLSLSLSLVCVCVCVYVCVCVCVCVCTLQCVPFLAGC